MSWLALVAGALTACTSDGGAPAVPTVPVSSLATATITGIGTVLVDGDGRTLYVSSDTGSGACNATCQSVWPRVVAPDGQMPTLAADVPAAKVAIATDDALTVITYGGMALHTYTGDEAAGAANGDGIQGVWKAVRVVP